MDTDFPSLSGQAIQVSMPVFLLIPRLKSLSIHLAQHQQNSELVSIFKPTSQILLQLLSYKDKYIRLFSTSCLVDILRILAPAPIYNHSEIKQLFEEISKSTRYLKTSNKPTFSQIMHVVTVLSQICGISLCIQHGFMDIIVKLIIGLIEQIDEDTGITHEQTIGNIIYTAFDETDNLMEQMIYPVIYSLATSFKNKTRYRIAVSLLKRNINKIIQTLDEFSYKLFENPKILKSSRLLGNEKYSIVYELFKINHDYVMKLLNHLEHEMALDDKTQAQKAVELVGKMISAKKSVIPSLYRSLFHEFLQKFDSDEASLRLAALSNTLRFVKNLRPPYLNPLLTAVKSRLHDSDEEVRRLTVQQLSRSGQYIDLDEDLISSLCDSILDHKPSVREEAYIQLADLFFSKCVQNHIIGNFQLNSYSRIGDFLVANFKKVSAMEDQFRILKILEEVLVPWKLKSHERINCMIGLQTTLKNDAKEAFRAMVKCKSVWGKHLYETLQCKDTKEFEERVSLLAGHLEEPLTAYVFLPEKTKSNLVLVKILREDVIAHSLHTLVSSVAGYDDKIVALKTVLDFCSGESPAIRSMMLNLTFRSCNLLICADQMEYVLSKTDQSTMEVLLMFGQCYPELILPHLSSILSILINADDKSPILELIQILIKTEHIQIQASYNLSLILTNIIMSGSTKEVKHACRLATSLMSSSEIHQKILKPITESLQGNLKDLSKVLSYISAINSIIQTDSSLILPYVSSILGVLINHLIPSKVEIVVDKNQLSIAGRSKCDALKMIINLILKNYSLDDYSPEVLFKMVLKIATNLKEFLYKRYNVAIEDVMPYRDSIEFRKIAVEGTVQVLNSKEFTQLMSPKVLLKIGCIAMCEDAELRSTLGNRIKNQLYEKGLIHPVMISILGLLANDPTYSKGYREDLVSVFEGMTKRSSVQDTPETRVSLLPEAYLIYLVFILAKLPSGGEKNIQRILSTYLDCIKKACKSVETSYLTSLSLGLKNYEFGYKKKIECDLELYWGDLNANVGLENVSDILTAHIKQISPNYIDDNKIKFYIPSAYFERKTEERYSNEKDVAKTPDCNLTPAQYNKRKLVESSSERPCKRIKK